MLRSMSSAISGLRNHQIYMDVVGQNIANVNTVGYKSSRVNFKEALAQTYSVGSAPVSGGIGGTNPVQVGLGVNLGGIDTMMTQGSMTTTGKTTDLAIQGEGFFMLGTAHSTDSVGDTTYTPSYYSRDGAFGLDKDGYLVDPVSGQYVLGAKIGYFPAGSTGPATVSANFDGSGNKQWYVDGDTTAGTAYSPAQPGHWVDADGNRIASADPSTGELTYEVGRVRVDPSWGWANFSISNDGTLTGIKADGTMDTIHHPRVLLAKFNNPGGLVRAGGNLFQAGLNSGSPQISPPGDNSVGMGSLMSGTLENSNVDLAEEFSRMIMAERGFQANSRVITSSDQMLQDLISMKQ